MAKRNSNSRIDTSGSSSFANDAFSGLSNTGLPAQPAPAQKPKSAPASPEDRLAKALKGKRLDLIREKSGRGGKTVTVVRGEILCSIGEAGRKALLTRLKKQIGVGGALNNDGFELQGDVRDLLEPQLSQLGARVVRAGG